MEDYIPESQEVRLNRRIAKFQREREHFQYLIKKGLHPIDIADQLIHNMFVSMRIGLEKKYPEATPEEIYGKMKAVIENDLKIKNLRRRSCHGRN
ncbi:hypothetical protein [Candidatus Lokiarchaeum ossiferum]|uniref:hypothetical protein n=1 Tax=Candidatus Lokiarchaeum ossiferum TaxID=2951803 RepID=UPI00352F7C63